MENDANVAFDGNYRDEQIEPFPSEAWTDDRDHGSPAPAQILQQEAAEEDHPLNAANTTRGVLDGALDFDEGFSEPARPRRQRLEQRSLVALALDISGDDEPPVPTAAMGEQCACCGLQTLKLWQGARTALDEPHAVCTLCYLTGHLDSPTAAHGRLAYLPGLAAADAIHLQRRALLSILGGNDNQQN